MTLNDMLKMLVQEFPHITTFLYLDEITIKGPYGYHHLNALTARYDDFVDAARKASNSPYEFETGNVPKSAVELWRKLDEITELDKAHAAIKRLQNYGVTRIW